MRDVTITLVAAGELRETLRAIVGEIAYAESGKPYAVDGALQFNVSHSGDYALIATTPRAPIGVDIERHRDRDWRRLAARFFAPDEASLLQSADDFYRLWVIKEAVLKAIGTGIWGGLATVVYANGIATTPHGTFEVELLDAPPGYSAAVAIWTAGLRPA